MGSLHEVGEKELFPIPPNPVVIQLDRLENRLRDKERELGAAHCEIKAMKMTKSLQDRALLELSDELRKKDDRLRTAEEHLESKNLEIKKICNEKKEALAGQFAAEATLRRVYATQENEELIPIEAVIAPLESDIKNYKNEVSRLQEDNKFLEHVTKSKEKTLTETEKILHSALRRVLILEDMKNQNLELRRQVNIYQEEKKTLERDLAKARVSVNRVAAVVANGWKDENDIVMPVKQWLEERKCLQGKIQRLQDKLAVSERTANAEAQLKEKLRLRLKTVEEGLRHATEQGLLNNPRRTKAATSRNRTSIDANKVFIMQHSNQKGGEPTKNVEQTNNLEMKDDIGEVLTRKKASKSQNYDDNGEENTELHLDSTRDADTTSRQVKVSWVVEANRTHAVDLQVKDGLEDHCEDMVSGFLYDRLQKEVICLQKSVEGKERLLNTKNDEIKMLFEKVDALTKALEQEFRKKRRLKTDIVKTEYDKPKTGSTSISKRLVKHHEFSKSS